MNALFEKGHQEPNLTRSELARVNDVLRWAQRHDPCTFYGVLVLVSRLMEFVYALVAHVLVKLTEEVTKVPINQGGPPAANTWGCYPPKGPSPGNRQGKIQKGRHG
jgi:hypothetical protein